MGSVYLFGVPATAVGDQANMELSWSHPQRYDDTPFRLTVDWGDGSAPDVVTVSGTTAASTDFGSPLHHRFVKEDLSLTIKACVEVVATGYTFCGTQDTAALNNRPIVNAADLRTWGPTDEQHQTVGSPARYPFLPTDPDGRQVISTGNPNDFVVHPSNIDLPGGYGHAALNQQYFGIGDNDQLGMVFGYQPGEASSDSADYVVVGWSHTGENFIDCSDPTTRGTVPEPALQAWRQHGQVNCFGTGGRTLVGSVGLTETGKAGSRQWRPRATTSGQRASSQYSIGPDLVEYDYEPQSLKVWINGALQFEAHPADPANPFPPGGVGFGIDSLGGARFEGTAPEPTFDFVQGKGGEIGGGVADGISMPMHDGALDTHDIRIDWGDGTPTTEGTRTTNTAKGWGWFDIGGTHVYDGAGTFHGRLCATDQGGLGMCFPFTAHVSNVGPVVDAGGDRPVDSSVVLHDMTFKDPGRLDTHTATVDWGDGSPAQSVDAIEAAPGGGVVTASHTYTSSGTKTLKLCVQDQGGATGCDTRVLEVTATNATPNALTVAGPTVPEGSSASVPVAFTDANVDDTHTVTVDWGDGTATEPVSIQDGRLRVGHRPPRVRRERELHRHLRGLRPGRCL